MPLDKTFPTSTQGVVKYAYEHPDEQVLILIPTLHNPHPKRDSNLVEEWVRVIGMEDAPLQPGTDDLLVSDVDGNLFHYARREDYGFNADEWCVEPVRDTVV